MERQRERRIVITGASGVGKTSLASLLAAQIGLPLIPELARQLCHQRGWHSPVDIPDQSQFRRDVLNAQIDAEKTVPSFVADRGTIDCWVLWERWQIASAMTYDTESYYESCRQQARSYTHIIYIPPMFTPEQDAFRWTEPDYIKQVDRMTRLALYDWQLLDRTLTVKTADPQERLQEVLTWLSH